MTTMNEAPAIISIRHAFKAFDDLKALEDVSLDIKPSEKVVLIGPSGSGKTTLLRSINALERLDKGQVMIEDDDIQGKAADLRAIRQKLGMVFQAYNLFPHLSILDNITIAQVKIKGTPKDKAEAVALDLLDKVGLKEKAKSKPFELSGGQQQRIAIARALALSPKVMLFDEPTSALDPELTEDVLGLIKDITKAGMGMVCSTHEMDFARAAADTIVFMEKGQIVEKGSPEQIFSSDNPRLKKFFEFYSRGK